MSKADWRIRFGNRCFEAANRFDLVQYENPGYSIVKFGFCDFDLELRRDVQVLLKCSSSRIKSSTESDEPEIVSNVHWLFPACLFVFILEFGREDVAEMR